MKIQNQGIKRLIFIISIVVVTPMNSLAQDPNIFYTSPAELMTTLGEKYSKIEIEIVQNKGRGIEKTPLPGKSTFRTIEFVTDNLVKIIDRDKDGLSDTTSYVYDKCGSIQLVKGHAVYSKYSNRYKNCKLMSRELNETQIDPSGSFHQWHLVRYVYNAANQLKKELIYDFADSSNLMYSNEYAYLGNTKDSMTEYYFDEGIKMKNRSTKYYTSAKLDSIHLYSVDFTLIDKTIYTYESFGKYKTVNISGLGTYYYTYNSKNEVESIYEEKANKDYLIRYFD